MGFFKNIFKKKPGGTFFGNLLRGATNLVPGVGPLYNSIVGPPPPQNPQLPPVRNGRFTPTKPMGPIIHGGDLPTATVTASRPDDGKDTLLGITLPTKTWWMLLAAGVFALWYFYLRNPSKGSRRRRY